jgi:hypothetical protein
MPPANANTHPSCGAPGYDKQVTSIRHVCRRVSAKFSASSVTSCAPHISVAAKPALPAINWGNSPVDEISLAGRPGPAAWNQLGKFPSRRHPSARRRGLPAGNQLGKFPTRRNLFGMASRSCRREPTGEIPQSPISLGTPPGSPRGEPMGKFPSRRHASTSQPSLSVNN